MEGLSWVKGSLAPIEFSDGHREDMDFLCFQNERNIPYAQTVGTNSNPLIKST